MIPLRHAPSFYTQLWLQYQLSVTTIMSYYKFSVKRYLQQQIMVLLNNTAFRKYISISMQSSKEQQEIRKPSSAINAKKQRKSTEWEDQRFLEENQRYQGNISCKDWLDKGQKWYGPKRSRRYQEEVEKIHRKLYKKYLHDPDNHDSGITPLEPDILEYEGKRA